MVVVGPAIGNKNKASSTETLHICPCTGTPVRGFKRGIGQQVPVDGLGTPVPEEIIRGPEGLPTVLPMAEKMANTVCHLGNGKWQWWMDAPPPTTFLNANGWLTKWLTTPAWPVPRGPVCGVSNVFIFPKYVNPNPNPKWSKAVVDGSLSLEPPVTPSLPWGPVGGVLSGPHEAADIVPRIQRLTYHLRGTARGSEGRGGIGNRKGKDGCKVKINVRYKGVGL